MTIATTARRCQLEDIAVSGQPEKLTIAFDEISRDRLNQALFVFILSSSTKGIQRNLRALHPQLADITKSFHFKQSTYLRISQDHNPAL